jgi:hypothetical protein
MLECSKEQMKRYKQTRKTIVVPDQALTHSANRKLPMSLTENIESIQQCVQGASVHQHCVARSRDVATRTAAPPDAWSTGTDHYAPNTKVGCDHAAY